MIDPTLQEAMAKRIGATVTRVNGSHVSMLSQPKAVADAIIAAAERASRMRSDAAPRFRRKVRRHECDVLPQGEVMTELWQLPATELAKRAAS